ncbi:hypothetical protein AB5J62_33460 [Amycolatopsis sp. cg5]|uniref:hypothetical protein n=1 Tax=Amycolatopsis sp. cg5 TaxID=3238802 RepID=UPI0035239F8A
MWPWRRRSPPLPPVKRSASQARIALERLADLNARRLALDPEATVILRVPYLWAGDDERVDPALSIDPGRPLSTDADGPDPRRWQA